MASWLGMEGGMVGPRLGAIGQLTPWRTGYNTLDATSHNTTQHNTIIGQELLHTSPPPYAAEHQTVAEVAECLSSFLGTFDMHLILGQMGKEVVHFP